MIRMKWLNGVCIPDYLAGNTQDLTLCSHVNDIYSKYSCFPIAKSNYQKNNWHRKQNLYSLHNIEHNNLTDAVNKHCKNDFDTNTNFKRLSEFIAITRASAQVSIGSWQQALKDG
jgi:hypothetical protein